MGQKSNKHQNVQTIQATWSGGLNLHDHPSAIGDSQLVEARNFWYADRGNSLVTRRGIKPVMMTPVGYSTLVVNTLPDGTGSWRLSGETSYRDSGSAVTLPNGEYEIEFSAGTGSQITPGNYNINLTKNSTIYISYQEFNTFTNANNFSNFYITETPANDSMMSFSFLHIADDSYTYYGIGYFTIPNINIVRNSNVLNSKLGIYSDTTDTDTFKIYIYDIDSAVPLTEPSACRSAVSNNISGGVEVTFESGVNEIDVTSLVAGIIDRPGWTSGNSIGFFIMPGTYPNSHVINYDHALAINLPKSTSNYLKVTYI